MVGRYSERFGGEVDCLVFLGNMHKVKPWEIGMVKSFLAIKDSFIPE